MPERKPLIVCGLGHVGYRVAKLAAKLGERVTVISMKPVRDTWRKELHPLRVRFVIGDATNPLVLHKAGIASARAVIITTDNDLANISIMLDAKKKNPGIKVVIRLFNHKLAEDIETHLGVQRALSVPMLASPAFTAASLGIQMMDSFSAATGNFSVARLTVTRSGPAKPGNFWGAAVTRIVGVLRSGRDTILPAEDFVLQAGDEVLVLAEEAEPATRFAKFAQEFGVHPHGAQKVKIPVLRRIAGSLHDAAGFLRRLSFAARLLIVSLVGIMAVSTAVFHHALRIPVLDALYFVVATMTTIGYGDINLLAAPPAIKLYGIFLMLAGAALIASVFSLITNFIFRLRFRELMSGVRVRKRDHIIVAGLGAVGSRLVKELASAGEKVVVIEKNADAELRQSLPPRVPFVQGDASHDETLVLANIAAAKSVVSVTGSDVTNLSIGLLSKRLNPEIRTTLRLFDPELAEKVQGGMGINHVISASAASAPTFVAAALLPATRHCVVWGDWIIAFCTGVSEQELSAEKFSRWQKIRDASGHEALVVAARPIPRHKRQVRT